MPPAGKTKTANGDKPKPTAAVAVSPPGNRSKARKSSAAPELIDGMREMYDAGGWASDGLQYDSRKAANNAAVVHRRAIIRSFGANPNGKTDDDTKVREAVGSQVWEVHTDDGKITGTVMDVGGKPTGKWVFAIGKTKTAAAAAA